MTREEASKIIKDGIEDMSLDFADEEQYEALIMAIQALSQEPSGDLISRQAVLNTLDRMDKALDTDRTVESYKELLTECYKDLPPVNQEPKTGHWISYYIAVTNERWYACSHCRSEVKSKTDYCHSCGYKMESEGV